MGSRSPVIVQKTFTRNGQSFHVAITLPRRQQPGPALPRVQRKGLLFGLDWLIGRLQLVFGPSRRLANVWLICHIDDTGLPESVQDWAAARNIQYAAQMVARWTELAQSLNNGRDLDRAKAWLCDRAIEPSRGVPRWILDNTEDLSD